jgi:formate dehydrogenase iron-sulfur subunit
MLAKAKARLAEVQKTNPKAQLYGDKLMGGTTYIYLLLDSPETYGLPVNPSASASLSLWKDYLQPYGGWLIPLAAAASLGSFFTTRLLKVADSKKGVDTHGQ